MTNRLQRVTLCRFRGATCPVDVDFDTAKPVAVIFGENGNGKSSIVDAIGFALTGDIGSLNLLSVKGAGAKYLPSLGSKPSDLEVRVSAGGETWTARLSKTEANITGPDERPPVHILRRSQVLRLVTSQPKERYEVLRGLIAVQQIDTCAQELRQAAKESKADVDSAAVRKAQAENTIASLWASKGKPFAESALAWARAEVGAESDTLAAHADVTTRLLDAVKKGRSAFADVQAAMADLEASSRRLSEGSAAVERAQGGDEVLLLDVLSAAERVLAFNRDLCPVCEQRIAPEDLRRRVNARLVFLKDARELRNGVADATRDVDLGNAVLATRRKSLSARLMELRDAIRGARDRVEGLPGAAFESEGDVEADLAALESLRPTIELSLEADQERKYQQTVIATNVKAVDDTGVSLLALQVKAKRLKMMSEIVEATRKAYVNDVLAAISTRAATMYARLHPEEGIGSVSLFLKEAAVGSLELQGTFGGTDGVPPQAYYSESHLDTLGVCVFLATAVRDTDAIVILDDLFTSVDDVHLGRVIDLLHDEAANFGHLVITTHYRAWRDRYRYARGPAANAQLIELLPWAYGHGIRHTKMRLSVEDLRDALEVEPLDRIGVASRAGILLEALFDDLTLRYRCRMPRAVEPHYTLGDLLDGMDSKLLKALCVRQLSGDIPLEPKVQKLKSMSFLRNQVGCHFSLAGSNVSDTDVRAFGDATLEFARAVVCEQCGELPRRQVSGQSWQCSCGKSSLVPLVKPGDKAA